MLFLGGQPFTETDKKILTYNTTSLHPVLVHQDDFMRQIGQLSFHFLHIQEIRVSIQIIQPVRIHGQDLLEQIDRLDQICNHKMSDYLKDLEQYTNRERTHEPTNPTENKFRPKPDPILLKLYPDPHPLSSEEQILFIKLTEGAFGFNEHVRNEALQILSRDYHVRFLAPYLCGFIRDAIRVNIVFPDLSLLIYSVRMVKSLMANPHVQLKQYLHVLLPAIISCVLSKKISKYNYDNHWTLRDFSAQVVSTICCTYTNKTNQIKTRTIKVYIKAIQEPRRPLTTLYGGLKGLSCFGEETIRACIIPTIPLLSRRICAVLEKTAYLGDNGVETKQVKRVTDLILTVTGPTLLQHKNTNDGGVTYVKEFGYLGYSLYSHVKTLEKIELDKKNHFSVYLLCTQ